MTAISDQDIEQLLIRGRALLEAFWKSDKSGKRFLAPQVEELAGKVSHKAALCENRYLMQHAYDLSFLLLACYKALGNQRAEYLQLHHIGILYRKLHRYSDAIDYLQQALTRIRGGVRFLDEEGQLQFEAENPLMEAITLDDMGLVYLEWGKLEEAQEHFEQALPLRRQAGDRRGESTTIHNRGRLYLAKQQYQKALEFFEQALKVRKKHGSRLEQGVTLSYIGRTYREWGKLKKATKPYKQALKILQEAEYPDLEHLLLKSEALAALGHRDEAIASYRHALSLDPNQEEAQQALRQLGISTSTPLDNS
ncbi:MAG: tetratricopeptide repeat protein [Promethearchaeota archaeon]